jgi:hypothetical protein
MRTDKIVNEGYKPERRKVENNSLLERNVSDKEY